MYCCLVAEKVWRMYFIFWVADEVWKILLIVVKEIHTFANWLWMGIYLYIFFTV